MGSPHLTFSPKNFDRKIVELTKKSYLPASIVALVAEVIRLQRAAEEHVAFAAAGELPETVAAMVSNPARHQMGAPLLLRERFPLDVETALSLAPDILQALAGTAPELVPLGEELAHNFAWGKYSLEDACRALLLEPAYPRTAPYKDGYFADWEQTHPDAPHFFSFVAMSSLSPTARVTARIVAPQHDNTTAWAYGHCPVCGSLPLMGRLSGPEGVRLHTCSFCSFEFRVPRLGCPFCLAEPTVENNYFVSDEEPGYQIHVCQGCKDYIKIVDFREFDRPYIPVLDDLGSLVLDMYAKQMGYSRPTLSAWGF